MVEDLPDIVPPGVRVLAIFVWIETASIDIKLSAEELDEVRKVSVAADATNAPRYAALADTVTLGDTPPLEGWVPRA